MDSKLMKHNAFSKPKPWLLRDYLMDDMSSCSSNGFKSFPRRQCCPSTVQFLIDIDLNHHRKFFLFNSKSAVSAFRRAIAAVKRLPFPSPENNAKPRNLYLSRKILRRSIFWKRKSGAKEIQRLKSFDQLIKEISPPPNATDTTDFTASDASSAGNSSSSSSQVKLNFTEMKREESDEVEALKIGGVSADSTTKSSTEQKQWSVSEEKEQFSPVSVLDCPFDDDEEVSSPFQHMQGSRKAKIDRFGCHAAVEPLDLSKRFGLDNEKSTESSTREQEKNGAERAEGEAMDLLREMMISRQWGEDDPIREEKEWRCFDGEIEEMASELEAVVFDGLVVELVVDISSAIAIIV